jgi:hypothetical protein
LVYPGQREGNLTNSIDKERVTEISPIIFSFPVRWVYMGREKVIAKTNMLFVYIEREKRTGPESEVKKV